MFLVNLRGFKSKKQSLLNIIKKEQPNVIVMNETQMTGNMKAELEPYKCWTKNRSDKGGGGIATAVCPVYQGSAMGAGEGEQGDEVMVTRFDAFTPALNIINCYGEQRKTKVEDVERNWLRLKLKMEEIRARGEFCLLAGDLNKLIGSDELGVPGNHTEVSPGGRLLRDLLRTEDWVLVNSLVEGEVVQGGPFTREDPATGALSCLDVMVASRELRPFIKKMVIDKERKMAVSRLKKVKGKQEVVFSDHFSLLLKMEGLPKRNETREGKKTIWNLHKEGGWDKYVELTDKYSNALNEVIEDDDKSIEEKMTLFEKKHDKIKFKAFGKKTIGRKKANQKEGGDTEMDTLDKQEERMMEELEEINKLETGKVGKVWEIRRKVIGGKKKEQDNNTIINPETGNIATSKNEIKEVSLKYCVETLKNNEPEEDFKDTIEDKKDKVKEVLKGKTGEFVASYDTFEQMVKKFRKAGKRNYDFLTKSSKSFQTVVFKFCSKMFEEENFPNKFQNTTLHMLYKGKGKRENLSDNRFIHCKEWLPRAAEGLVVQDGLKRCLLAGSSMYQVGGQPGHRPEEMIYVLKSMVAKQKKMGKMMVIQCYDVSKFFDKEQMEDAVLTCQNRGAHPKAVRLWFKLNENTRIQVKTPAGMSEFGHVGAVVGQGTIGGALVSQAVLDDGVTEHFPSAGRARLEYGSVPMAPLMWMDDALNPAGGLEEARDANKRMNFLMKERGLSLNREKSVCLIIGNKKQREDAAKRLDEQPLECGDFFTKQKESEKWLGQEISSQGLAHSVVLTVKKREGKIKAAGREIAVIVNDWRSRAVGGMESALQLWEACCIPSLLHGAATWVDMTAATAQKLNSIQNWFLRLVLQVGPGTPATALLWDTGVLDMELRVWIEKLMLMLHIRRLDEQTLANKIYQEQRKNKWPGLADETEKICTWLEVQCVHATELDVQSYRDLITQVCHKKNEQRLRKKANTSEKVTRIKSEVYGKKKYLEKKRIENVRIQFRARFQMLPFAGNYGKDRRFSHTEWLCFCRMEREEESHLLDGRCEVYGDIREKYGELEDDEDLVQFFQEVLERRGELEKESRDAQELEVQDQDSRELEVQDTLVVGNTTDDASTGEIPGQAGQGAFLFT